MAFIIIIIIILFLVLIGWTWNNLEDIEKPKKVGYIIISILITYIITLIIFNVSKSEIEYQNQNMVTSVQNILVAVFTAVNGFIVVQYFAKIVGQMYMNQIEKNTVIIKVVILLIIFIACIIFECGYMKDIQIGIINVYNLNK